MRKYFEDRKLGYSAPEYRSLVTLTLTQDSVAKPETVSDADAQKRYDEIKGDKFGTPEKRTVEQVLFTDEAAAKAARDKLDAGASFEDIVKDQGLTLKDVSLGTVTRGQLIDKDVADVAFELPESAVSAPVKTRFGYVLVRVSKIEPSSVKPFSEVAGEIKRDIAISRARGEIARLHDAIEDQRTSGKSLADAAKSAGLEVRSIAAVDAAGKDQTGAPVADLANGPALLKAAFASDVGVDNETLTLPQGGYQWFEVAKIEKARQKTFEEARPEVEKAWRDDETARLLSAKSADIAKRLDGGETLAAVAAAEGNLEVKHASDVKRSGGGKDLPANAVAQVFNVGVGGVGSARLDDGGRVIFKVVDAVVPPIDFADPSLVSIGGQVKKTYGDDLVAQYLGEPAERSRRQGQRAGPGGRNRRRPMLSDAGISNDAAGAAFAASYAANEPCLVSARLIADLETPVSAFLKLSAGRQGRIFLLESVEGGAARGRYSMIGLDPDIVWRAFGESAEINRNALTQKDAFSPCAAPPLEFLARADRQIAHRDGRRHAADGGRRLRLSRL